jgi:hypothetical protein
MASWTNIADATLEPGKPIRAIDARALRENPIAIAEGAAGAPKIETAGITDANVTTAKLATNERMTTANVTGATAGASAGAVGTYAFLSASSPRNPDSTLAGSSLTYAGALNAISATGGTDPGTGNPSSIDAFSFAAGASTTLSGTWRCMGRISTSASSTAAFGGTASATAATLWLRIS